MLRHTRTHYKIAPHRARTLQSVVGRVLLNNVHTHESSVFGAVVGSVRARVPASMGELGLSRSRGVVIIEHVDNVDGGRSLV